MEIIEEDVEENEEGSNKKKEKGNEEQKMDHLAIDFQRANTKKNTFRVSSNIIADTDIVTEDYIQNLIAQRTLAIMQENADREAFAGDAIQNHQIRDRMYLGQRMRALFKRTSENSLQDSVMLIVAIPLNFFRDYTIPTSDYETWNRNRNSIIAVTLIPSFLWLFEMYKDENQNIDSKNVTIACCSLVPGIIISMLIRLKVKATDPPQWMVTLFAIIAFVQSICWIKTSADSIVDLL